MNDNLQKLHLYAVLIETQDPESLAELYRQAFDLEPARYFGPDHLGMDLANTTIGLDRTNESAGEGSPRLSIWFQVDQIEEIFQQLLSMKAQVKFPPDATLSPGEILAKSTTRTAACLN